MKLDKEEFKAWVQKNKIMVYASHGPMSCPIAKFLQREKGYEFAMVNPYYAILSSTSSMALPEWARQFVYLFDRNFDTATWEEVMHILQRVDDQW